MGLINQGRYDRMLRRTTAQVGPGSKVSNALEDLFPTLEVESAPMELLRAGGWTFGTGSVARTAAAGQTNNLALFNPADSGHLIVLTKFIFYANPSADMVMGPIFTSLTGSSLTGAQRDTRDGEIKGTVGRIQHQDNAAASLFGLFRAVSNVNFILEDPNGIAVLAPGSGWQLHNPVVAATMRASFFWRERVAEPEELNF